jgi:hypothetical protein
VNRKFRRRGLRHNGRGEHQVADNQDENEEGAQQARKDVAQDTFGKRGEHLGIAFVREQESTRNEAITDQYTRILCVCHPPDGGFFQPAGGSLSLA